MAKSILQYLPLFSAIIIFSILILAFFNFSITRRNLQRQTEQQIASLMMKTEQQIYSRIMDVRLKPENTKQFTKMAGESTLFKERFCLVDNLSEYYTIVSFLDLFEYVYHLNEMQMIDKAVWDRWKILVETIMTIKVHKHMDEDQ